MKRIAFLLLLIFSVLQAQTVAKLPEPGDGNYEQSFSYDLTGVIVADLNGNDTLDFVTRSDYVSGTIRLEAKLYNKTAVLWSVNTGVTSTQNSNPLDVPMIAWDFDNDGDDEVYYQYYSGGVRRHRIINGSNGASLVDAACPNSWGDYKSMLAIAYIGGRPRIVHNIDYWSTCYLTVYTAYNGSTWSLSAMSGFPFTNSGGFGPAHDMIRTADVDLTTGSDDEILAGTIVLNGDGTVRYDIKNLVPNNNMNDADQAVIGFFDPQQPNRLVYMTGDGNGDNMAAVWAATGALKWSFNFGDFFGASNWTHWHGGYVRKMDDGARVLAIDRDTDRWVMFDAATGADIDSGLTAPPYCSGVKPIQWDDDDEMECGGVNYNNQLYLRADVGSDGCEEVFGFGNDSTQLKIQFNTSCAGRASRYDNQHYRQDVAMSASGYAPNWLGALEYTQTSVTNDPSNYPIITNVATSNIGLTSAHITWDTHEGGTSQVEYGLTTGYGSSTTLDATLVLSHSVTLTSLTTGATYHFRVKSKDTNNNTTTSGDYTFVAQCSGN